LKVDLIVETNMTPDAIADFGQIAESRGIHGIWTCDYFAHWDPFIALVPLAKATATLRMGALAAWARSQSARLKCIHSRSPTACYRLTN